MKIPSFDSLVWGSLRLAPIKTVLFSNLYKGRTGGSVVMTVTCVTFKW